MPIITPDQQRDFEAARRKLEAVCLLWDAPWYVNTRETVEPEDCERVRWLLVRMGLARGTPGGARRRRPRAARLRDICANSVDSSGWQVGRSCPRTWCSWRWPARAPASAG